MPLKLTQVLALLVDIEFATKYPEIRDIGFSPIEQFIWSLVKEAVWIQSVGSIACSVDSFGPKLLTSAILIKY